MVGVDTSKGPIDGNKLGIGVAGDSGVLAQIAGVMIEMTRLHQGQSEHIEALATMCSSPNL